MIKFTFACVLCVSVAQAAPVEWRVLPPHDNRQPRPPTNLSSGKPIKVGDRWPEENKFRWVVADVTIPETINDKPTAGQPVGMHINGGDGGEIWVNGELQGRFDNDHPGLALLTERAAAQKVRVAVQFYGKVQGGDEFGEARLVLIEPKRAVEPLKVRVSARKPGEAVPDGLIGLSQGGGLSDYEDATAAKLREGGFRWFRMDNILTNALKKGPDGQLVYDWTDFDRRAEFIVGKMKAQAIFAVSYMPQVLDAVENHDRQSAPRDYKIWEDLCYEAARRCVEKGLRVAYWEVWNEVNTGWLKPGPEDVGGEPYKSIYNQALGYEQTEAEVIRRFEAYCKLYRATARGVLRADPKAKIGGPALASGPHEHKDCGHCFHGQGFAKGLMLWCRHEKLPFDFASWHEYFQPADVIAKQADTFREYLKATPEFRSAGDNLMITEWNEAWWVDRPQDHELGAAWCANSVTRAFIPKKISFPCFFYVKQNDMNFRGDYSLLMQNNVPKANFNMAKIFNGLSGKWLPVEGTDDDVSAVACWDESNGRLAVVLVNFRDRYAIRRRVQLQLADLPAAVQGGTWRQTIVDATHANVWHDVSKAELEPGAAKPVDRAALTVDVVMEPNSIHLFEVEKGR